MIIYDSLIDRVNQYLLIAAFFFLPLTVVGNNIAIWLITIIWLLTGNYKTKLHQIKNNSLAMASILFFLAHVVALLWTENISWGLEILRKMLPFLLVLPIFLTITKLNNSKYYISAFLLAISISESLSYLIWLDIIEPFGNATVTKSGLKNPTPLMSHISYNPFLAFAFYLVVNKLISGEKIFLTERVLYTFFAFTMSFNMFITGGRAGQVMFFAAVVILSFQYFKTSQIKAIIISLLLTIFITISAYSFSDIFKSRIDATVNSVMNYEENKLTSIGYRLTFLINSFELVKRNPIIGVGTGDFPDEYEKFNSINSPDIPSTVQPHNMYMLILTQLGVIGLASLFWIFFTQFKIALASSNSVVKTTGVAMPIFFLIIMWSDSYLLGHFTSNLFILFSSFIYSNRLNV
ncbi:O-antigen ligase family protein [Candidatus Pseudothioglobus sp. Uisw_016]|uniref:O-antigen ligase family protein n=1 Tax=Candidatus Pseudothioglobus sp. Uisw_016 TaxID=3230995 RepID=UPI003A841836